MNVNQQRNISPTTSINTQAHQKIELVPKIGSKSNSRPPVQMNQNA